MMLPFQTAVERPCEHPAEGEVRCRVRRRVLLRGVEVDVLTAVAGVRAGDARLSPLANEPRLHTNVAARRAKTQRHPVERGVPAHLRALRTKDPALL